MKYRKAVIKIETSDDILQIEKDKTIDVSSIPVTALVSERSSGDFAHRGYYLNSDFDWQVVMDKLGTLVLIPTKK